MSKVNSRNTRTRCEICSKLTIKTQERRLASFWLGNLCRNDTFERHQVHYVYHGLNRYPFLDSKIWDVVPAELKQSESLGFKLKLKNCIPFECHADYV